MEQSRELNLCLWDPRNVCYLVSCASSTSWNQQKLIGKWSYQRQALNITEANEIILAPFPLQCLEDQEKDIFKSKLSSCPSWGEVYSLWEHLHEEKSQTFETT